MKRIIGWAIFVAFFGFLIWAYGVEVMDNGWWRGLIKPMLLIFAMVAVMTFAAYCIISPNKPNKKN